MKHTPNIKPAPVEAQCWTASPAAAALLASCAASPPPTRYVTGTFGASDGEVRYVSTLDDRRVSQLRRLHDAAWDAAFDRHAAGELSRADLDVMLRPDVQGAIARVVGARLAVAA